MKRATKQRLSLAAIMVLLLSGCGSVGKETKKQEQQVLRVGIDSELSTADVSLAMDNTAADVMSQVGEGLFSFDEKGEAKPALATEKVQPSNDGLIYTFTIRKDAKWSNGEPITANDFEYSWKRTVDPKTASPQAYYFEGLKNYRAIVDGGKSKEELGVTAVKNKNYWDQANVSLDKVDVQVVKEVNTGKNLFEGKELDVVKISGEIVAQEQGNAALKIREIPGTYYIQLNTQKDLLANKNARRAIALSLNSERLAKNVLNDGSKKALGFVPTGFTNQETQKDFAEELGDLNPSEPEKAKELWQTAKKELGIEKAELTILSSDTENAKKISEYVQGALADNLENLTVNVSPVPFNNRLEKSRSGDFDIVVGGWTPVYADPIDFLNLLQSKNSNNFGKWSNKTFDQLLQEANVTYANKYEERWKTLQKADQLVAEEAPLVPLYQLTEARLVADSVQNLVYGPLGSGYYKSVSISDK
ncbi:peptide ABC transporter substrate-binding protein [Enterococcus faecalis]|uniref:peptide ABC transporter substrate-binding protein n=1 Tax=Enterococcus faecalis TaxID=1351 RepID=UPI0010C13F65|nr:peptide ABC transporter substrate-binding protein [Enterococcus faecalis]TKO60994.1 peptide ABC transporter substrate-binding protein [Enterococcus faecalis]TKO74343.1 peptide ABC transporter substrate-binding protein [Enterococcus faecalis]TKP03514.1 peptide ABC transporter substrate-binding protein [Enterococcus faecalis]